MEIAVLWFLSMMAMDNEIQKTNENVRMLETEVVTLQLQQETILDTLEDHEITIVKTAASHSAFYASQQLKNEGYEEDINLLNQKVDTLKEMSEGESSTITSDVPAKP